MSAGVSTDNGGLLAEVYQRSRNIVYVRLKRKGAKIRK